MSSSRPLAIVTVLRQALDMSLPNAACGRGLTSLSQPTSRPSMRRREEFGGLGAAVTAVETDLATIDGVDRLYGSIQGRPVDALLANAGHGLGKGSWIKISTTYRHVVDTNVTGTLYLLQKVARDMRARGEGTDSYYRFNRRLHTGDVSGRLQRHQGVSGFFFVCAAA